MFLLTLCLVGTALAAPAIPEETMLPADSHLLVSPYIPYSAPILPIRTLEMVIEPEPKEENAELPEPEEEWDGPKEESDGPKKEWDGPKEESDGPKKEWDGPKEEWDAPKEEWDGPKEEFPELEEPKELPVPPEFEAPKPGEPVVVKLDIPKPPSFISNWISSLHNFSFPSFIGDWFHPGSPANPPKVLLHPAYYAGYPGAVIIEKP